MVKLPNLTPSKPRPSGKTPKPAGITKPPPPPPPPPKK